MSTSEHQNKSTRDKYHHGDLRNTLINIGVEVLASDGADALSLRAVAKQAGVSHNAPYQHFADKEALIAAIAEQGFRILADAIDASQTSLADAPTQTRLIAAGQSYVRFAMEHPSHLQVMFGRLDSSLYPDLAASAAAALDRLIAIAAEGHARGDIADDPAEVATTIWMMVHGLSAILIAGKLPQRITHDRDPHALAETYIRLTCEGVIRR